MNFNQLKYRIRKIGKRLYGINFLDEILLTALKLKAPLCAGGSGITKNQQNIK